MLTLNSPQVVQETVFRWKKESKISFVPTMGCLHEGHLQLIQSAKQHGERVAVSIFVNPLQFGPAEDLAKYPRTFEADVEKLQALGVDLLFHPTEKDLYPDGFSTHVSVGNITERLCGAFRPGHFDGVATVCLKLFQIIQPDFAIFGQKDFQQLRVVQKMVTDLNLPVSIVAHPTVRDTEGLAYSSRNAYLSTEDRAHALTIPRTIQEVRTLSQEDGRCTVADIKKLAKEILQKSALNVQYCEVTEGRTLRPTNEADNVHSLCLPHFFVAALAGSTRLIDNVSLNGES